MSMLLTIVGVFVQVSSLVLPLTVLIAMCTGSRTVTLLFLLASSWYLVKNRGVVEVVNDLRPGAFRFEIGVLVLDTIFGHLVLNAENLFPWM